VELEKEVKRLKEKNGVESYEKENAELREKLEQVNQRLAQIEVPTKNGNINSF